MFTSDFKFGVQWHLTDTCDQRCKHCYIWNDPSSQRKEVLQKENCYEIINQLEEFENNFGVEIMPVITGGDPLLYPYFWEVVEEIQKRKWKTTILGNPFHLNKEVSQKLSEFDCFIYQMSIDGIKKTHDLIRNKGSFDETFDKIKVLKDFGILTMIMSTVSEINIQEIPEVLKICVDSGVDRFTFARYSGEKGNFIPPDQYKKFLDTMYNCYQKFESSQCSFPYKDHLWKPFFEDVGLVNSDKNINYIADGCHCGFGHISILPNGDIYACRRFESLVGNLFEKNLSHIFVSPELEKYREIEEMECFNCELKFYCRGCPAVSYGNYKGDWRKKDPQCWREI